MDGNGGCCIARWTDEGHVVSGYDKSKMDMIMLKFRPIAPKPVSPNGTPSDSSNNSPRDGPHAKGPTRGRKKNNNNNNSKKVGRKRKSTSPENRIEEEEEVVHQGVTLLPLFPEAPDLSPTNQQQDSNNNNNIPIWVNFNDVYNTNNTPVFKNNYGNGW